MATNDPNVRLVKLSPVQILSVQLASRAAEAVLQALQVGRYEPTPEQLKEIARGVSATALAMAALVDSSATDEQLDGAADDVGHTLVSRVLGPPRPEALQ